MTALAKILLALAALVVALTILVDWAVEYLWLGNLGFSSVFWTIRMVKVGLFLAVFVPVFLYFWINFRVLARQLDLGAIAATLAGRAMPQLSFFGPVGTGFAGKGTPVFLLAVAATAALVFGLILFSQWDVLLRFLWSQPFGRSDPVFDRDIGFYLFTLPFYEIVQNTLVAVTVMGSAIVLWAYLNQGAIRFGWRRGIETSPLVYRHVTINLALLLIGIAWGYYLDLFGILRSSSGAVWGAGFTEVYAVRPGLWITLGATLALAAAIPFPGLFGKASMALTVIGGYLVISVLFLAIVPWSVQGLYVQPNELELETPFLRRNIDFTRRAYGLDKVEERPLEGIADLTREAIQRNRDTIDNIRLWDWRPLSQTYRQLQRIRSYYEITDVDVDRYLVDGAFRQVMLAARELSNELPEKSDTWVNRYLQYTHGYGLVMTLTSEKSAQGTPVLLIKDLPPQARSGLEVEQPEIYYGEKMSGYRLVATAVKELDFPKGDENVYSNYSGKGGVELGSLWRRLLFAWHQMDINILLTTYVTAESRIQLWRRVKERVDRVAPFLLYDDDPYLVLSDGRIYWIQDAYTVSDWYPYSEPSGSRFNYIRNSVKVVIDAFDGSLDLYVVDAEDPVLGVYRQALPALFRDLDEMPEGLRGHLRYPLDLFTAQVAMYSTYHMTLPQVFYNREDVWAVPHEKYGGEEINLEPYYILMRLPGEERLQFLLMTPLTPRSRDNMIAWMAARSDFPGYGKLLVYKLPKDRLIMGPIQVEAKIDQDTLISQQLSLWDQRGSRVIRGNLLVVPIEHSFIYVEPVYLIAEGTNIPQLKRIIVSDGDRLAMEPMLADALDGVFGHDPRHPAPAPPAAADPVTAARETLRQAEEALRAGDWDAFGRAMQTLRELLVE